MTCSTLQTRELHVKLGGKKILHDINLSFEEGKVYALCGGNGCGKTTLLKALIGLLPLVRGEVLLQGKNIRHYSAKERARTITMLAQIHQTIPQMTVRELVACGRFSHWRYGTASANDNQTAIQQALQWTQLIELADCFMSELSGGQQQRAWLAMAVAQQTSLLLLDEPSNFLDVHHQVEMLAMVRMLSREHGFTVIWVLHDLNQAAAFSDSMILLKNGALFCQDVPDKIMQPSILAEVFSLSMPRLQEAKTPVCLPDYATYLE